MLLEELDGLFSPQWSFPGGTFLCSMPLPQPRRAIGTFETCRSDLIRVRTGKPGRFMKATAER